MNTNMIDVTNQVLITNTVIITNTLGKVDIIGIERDWLALGVTIFGAVATVLSAIFMWSSVHKMAE